LANDVSSYGASLRRIDLQDRLRNAAHTSVHGTGNHASAKRLHHDIRKYLFNASAQRLLNDAPEVIRKNLLFTNPKGDNHFDIAVGTVRNFKRTKDLPHFTRRDGGWFDFQLLVKEEDGRAEILTYDFELRLPSGSCFDFVRFDLNPPDERAKVRDGLRSHVHINSDDDGLSAPAPVMSPFEILDLFLHGLFQTGRVRHSARKEE